MDDRKSNHSARNECILWTCLERQVIMLSYDHDVLHHHSGLTERIMGWLTSDYHMRISFNNIHICRSLRLPKHLPPKFPPLLQVVRTRKLSMQKCTGGSAKMILLTMLDQSRHQSAILFVFVRNFGQCPIAKAHILQIFRSIIF